MTTEKIFRTEHLVDKESYPQISFFRLPRFSNETLPILRNLPPLLGIDNTKKFIGVATATQNLPPRDNAPPVHVDIYSPQGNASLVPGYLMIHGGGFVIGKAISLQDMAVKIVQECGVVVVCVDYRLAPENNKMDLVEDCYTALLWMHDHGHKIYIDKDRLAFGGQSAGGGLAAGLALLVRDRKVIKPVFQSIEYGMLDDRTCIRPTGDLGEFVWNPEDNRFGWSCLLGDIPIGAPDTPYYIVPGRATDLSGLPSAFVSVGALDLFLDENIEHARKLIAGGVPTELIVYPGLVPLSSPSPSPLPSPLFSSLCPLHFQYPLQIPRPFFSLSSFIFHVFFRFMEEI
eukprot:Phypoly_transcript_11529.p1 GENE.Phypoly_transcript_11529~~Phypoly_transcript_11529.p1  ORF type:complete len:369 (+),score=36.08 Phypoly_transcript_11529:78-1109(+)